MDGTSINSEKLINYVENNLSRNEIQIEENQINNSDIKVYEKELSFSTIKIYVLKLGNDYNITISGGDNPHIGTSVLAIPRTSLTGDESISATSSVMNMVGHKDEQICRYIAEKVCINKNAVVLCSGGFHVDNISKDGIDEVLQAVKELADMI